MSVGIQEIIIAVCVVASILFLIMRYRKNRRTQSGCSSCRLMNAATSKRRETES